jgi:hypothetical protein
MTRRELSVILSALIAASPLPAQVKSEPLVQLVTVSNRAAIANRLPFTVVALVIRVTDNGSWADHATINAPANSVTESAVLAEGAVLADVEFLSRDIPWLRLPNCAEITSEQSPDAYEANLAAQLQSIGTLSTSDEGRHLIALSQERARLELQSNKEFISLVATDPVANDKLLSRLVLANSDWERQSVYREMETNERTEQAAQVAAMALDFEEENAKERELSAKDRDRLKTLLTAAQQSAESLEAAAAARANEAAILRDYWNVLTEELDKTSKEAQSTAITPQSAIERACTGPSRITDIVKVYLLADTAQQLVTAKISFDKGEGHKTELRRLEGSDWFAGYVVWPNEASEASAAIRSPSDGSWLPIIGTVSPGRASVTSAVSKVKRGFADLRKRYDTASAKADAIPILHAVIIP